MQPLAKIISLDRVQGSSKVAAGHPLPDRENRISSGRAKKVNLTLRFHLVAIAALLAICTCAAPSYADTQGVSPSNCASTSFCDGYSFSATLNNNGNSNYSLSYTITNVGGPAANPQSWSLTLFGNQYNIGSTFSNFTMSLDGAAFNNTNLYAVNVGKSSNSVGGGGCNSSISGGVCVIGSGALPTLNTGDNLTFNFDFSCTNCTQLANWIFLSQGTNVNGGNAYAISQTQAVPEPSTPILLFCSLLAALGLLAIPRVRNMVLPAQQSGLHSLKRI